MIVCIAKQVFSEDADRDDHFLGEVHISLKAIDLYLPQGQSQADTSIRNSSQLPKQAYPLCDPTGRVSALDTRRQRRKLRSTPGSTRSSQSPAAGINDSYNTSIGSVGSVGDDESEDLYGMVELGVSFVADGCVLKRHPPGDGTVYVTILHARGLVAGLRPDLGCNPYAKVSMTSSMTSSTGLAACKTITQENTTSPVFNEVCQFGLAAAGTESTDWNIKIELWDDQKSQVNRTDEMCIQNDEFYIQNEEVCTKTRNFEFKMMIFAVCGRRLFG